MTLSEIITNVRYNIGEASEGYWNNVELTTNINKAIDDLNFAIFTVNKKKATKDSSLISTGASEIALPNDFDTLLSIRETNNKFVFIPKSITTNKFQDALNIKENMQSFYYDIVNKIITGVAAKYIQFSPPIPSGYTLNISYTTKIPSLLNMTDDLGIYTDFCYYIIDKATYYSLLKGPSGNYEEFKSNAREKLDIILSTLKDTNIYKHKFVEGYLE